MSEAGTISTMMIGGIDLEVDVRGSGKPLLLLTGEEQLEQTSPFVDTLAQKYQVIMPSPPGFGHTPRPDWLTRTEDIPFIYSDLARQMNLQDALVVGCSHGGWIAAELAVLDDSFMSKLVLVDPYGVKIGGPYDRDIQDMWIQTQQKVASLMWKNPELAQRDFTAMTEDAVTVVAQNRETFARFGWDPYMHNPKLKYRLHRIRKPTLVVWGEDDGIVTTEYGKAYAGLIPGAQFGTVPDAGHYPHLENQAAFMAVFERFAG
ncbi:MAG: alpha/beta hydrolase [Hyphomicrobiales bacterium]|nr:alpha/beta hydrolase [Hyphomicrobiales bacterium]